MKTLVGLIAVIAISNGLLVKDEPEGCQFCIAGMNMFYDAVNSDNGLSNAMNLLDQKICQNPQVEDPEGCKIGVQTWWPQISELIFNHGASPYICNALNGECLLPKQSIKKALWDCNVCQRDIQAVAGLYRADETARLTADYLAGEAFCQSMDLDEVGVAYCQDVIYKFIPPAFQVLFTYVEAHAEEICFGVYDGICDSPVP